MLFAEADALKRLCRWEEKEDKGEGERESEEQIAILEREGRANLPTSIFAGPLLLSSTNTV